MSPGTDGRRLGAWSQGKDSKSQMSSSAFVEAEFFMLIAFSLILPVSIYGYMMRKRSISHKAVLLFGIILIVIAGINVFLLQRLANLSASSPSLIDDIFFRSELSVALYLLPAVFAGIGINMISHILISHLTDAESKFDHDHR